MVQVKVTRQDTHLEHKAFKYLKKKKVNGKWRYYYDTDALKSELNDYKKALSSEDEREAYMKATNAERDNSKKTARKRKEEDERAAANTEMFKKKYEEADATTKNMWKTWSSEATKTKKKYEEAKTLKGKLKSFKEAFDKHNPKTTKAIKKGEAYISKTLYSRKA